MNSLLVNRMKSTILTCVLFSTLKLIFSHPPKIILNTKIFSDSHEFMVDSIRSEVRSNKREVQSPSSGVVSKEIEVKLLEIQRSIDENTKQLQGLIKSHRESLNQTKVQCSPVPSQTKPEQRDYEKEMVQNEISTISLELAMVGQTLERIQESLLSSNHKHKNVTKEAPILNGGENLTKAENVTVERVNTDDFDFIISQKPEVTLGKSYNGSTSSLIEDAASRKGFEDRHVVIEFVNYLNTSITDFELYDKFHCAFHHGPESIPPNTNEIFTFIQPNFHSFQSAAFSYRIPKKRVRLGAILRFLWEDGAGIAFLEDLTSMEHYFRRNHGIPGSSLFFLGAPSGPPLGYIVSYQNLRARATLQVFEFQQGHLKIELLEVP